MIEIDHGNGLVTRYAHALKLKAKVGQVVVRGQKIAIVGGSGSGKTTVARMIAGLYRPTNGTIMFDGIDF